MDKISKALKKLKLAERKTVKNIILLIEGGQYLTLDLKKLKGYDNIFRVRHGRWRVIFKVDGINIKILTLEKRNDNTYKF
jgi:mRNA-degrading endonuclease RelE of RelBE toxin-antitoxin system